MHHRHILNYESLVKALEDEMLAIEVMRMIEQTLTKNKSLWFAPVNCNDDFAPLQTLLHQLKGILPMLTTPEFSQTLQDETQYLQQHLAVSVHYPQLQDALERLRVEISTALTSNVQKS